MTTFKSGLFPFISVWFLGLELRSSVLTASSRPTEQPYWCALLLYDWQFGRFLFLNRAIPKHTGGIPSRVTVVTRLRLWGESSFSVTLPYRVTITHMSYPREKCVGETCGCNWFQCDLAKHGPLLSMFLRTGKVLE